MPFRDRTPRRLLLELAGIVAVFGTAAFLIWWFTRPPSIHNVRPVGGPNMDISHDARAQWASSVAIDPADPDILLAGSSDELQDTRVYSSCDGGSTWQTTAGPPGLRSNCDLAAGPGGAVLAWLRFVGATNSDEQHVLVSRSSDGVSWSTPLRLPFQAPFQASVAVAPDGDVYLAVADAVAGLVVMRSRDGGRTFGRPHRVSELHATLVPTCGHGDVILPAQPQRCVGPSPKISVDGRHVLVTFAQREDNGTMMVSAAVLDRALRPVRMSRVGPADDDRPLERRPLGLRLRHHR
jgi:hypothetical protein